MTVAQEVAKALQRSFQPAKIGLLIAGLEVRHVHVHVHLSPVNSVHDLDFDRQAASPDPAALDAAAERIRSALRELGHSGVVPG